MSKKIIFPTLTRVSALFFKVGVCIMTLVFLYIFMLLTNTPENERAWVLANVPAMLEYAFMSLTLIVCGSLVLDMAQKNK